MPHQSLSNPSAEAISLLEVAVERFTVKIGEPLIVVEERGRSIRYPDRTPEVKIGSPPAHARHARDGGRSLRNSGPTGRPK